MRSPTLPRPEPPSIAQAVTSNRASQEDLREYLTFLDDTNLSEAQKIELLQTLWSIMSTFVGYVVEAVFHDDVSGGGDFMKRPGMVAMLRFLKTRKSEDCIVIFDDYASRGTPSFT